MESCAVSGLQLDNKTVFDIFLKNQQPQPKRHSTALRISDFNLYIVTLFLHFLFPNLLISHERL